MKQKMKLVAAIVAGMGALAAQAGVITATAVKTYAVESFGAAAVPVKLPIVSYQNAQPITGTFGNPNTFYVDLTLSNGAVWSDAAGGAIVTGAGGTSPTLVLSNGNVGNDLEGQLVTTTTATTTTLRYAFLINNGIVYPAGISTFSLGVPGPTTNVAAYAANVSGVLGMDGGACVVAANNSLNMTIKLFDSSGNNQVDTVGTYVETAVVARSARGISGAVASSGTFAPTAEFAKIDVLAAAAAKSFTAGLTATTNKINLGSVTFTDGTTVTTAGVPYTLAGLGANYNGTDVVVNGSLAAFAGAGSIGLFTDKLCTAPALGNVAAAATSATSTTIAITGGANIPVTATPYYVCGMTNTTTAIDPSQYTGYATVKKTAVSNQLPEYAGGAACVVNLYKTDYNGAVVTVRNYSPVAANASGWNQYTRIINTGATASTLKAFYVNGDGTQTASTVLTMMAVPVGGNVTLSNSAIEAAIGAPSAAANAGTNPRLRIVATTGSLRVQNYIVQPNGAWFEASGGQDEGALPASSVTQGTNQ